MTKRRKSVQPKKPEEGALNPVELTDRLYDVMAELAIVSDAVAGSELSGLQECGMQMILIRQIDEIRAVKDIIHPPDAELS